jgi:hypothetical protein
MKREWKRPLRSFYRRELAAERHKFTILKAMLNKARRLCQFRGLSINQIVPELSCYCLSENGVENHNYIPPFASNLPSQNSTVYTAVVQHCYNKRPALTPLQSYIHSIYSSITHFYLRYILYNISHPITTVRTNGYTVLLKSHYVTPAATRFGHHQGAHICTKQIFSLSCM